jgi:hypothetical protein
MHGHVSPAVLAVVAAAACPPQADLCITAAAAVICIFIITAAATIFFLLMRAGSICSCTASPASINGKQVQEWLVMLIENRARHSNMAHNVAWHV